MAHRDAVRGGGIHRITYGWIDGVRRKVDADRTKQLISPRRQHVWADTYKQRADRLETEGRMKALGRAKIAQAKAAGLWDALAHVDALDVPSDLTDALGTGSDWFQNAAPSYRRNVLRWIASAKKPDTRIKRIGIVAEHAQNGKKVPNY